MNKMAENSDKNTLDEKVKVQEQEEDSDIDYGRGVGGHATTTKRWAGFILDECAVKARTEHAEDSFHSTETDGSSNRRCKMMMMRCVV